MPWGYVDDEALAAAEEMVGQPLRRERHRWVSEATPDAIDHFVEGIGDANPLYKDADYAAGTRWGTRLAPPCFLYAVDLTVVAPKLPGVQWIAVGNEWTFYDVIRLRDEFDVKACLKANLVKGGDFSTRWVLQQGQIDYTRRADQFPIARSISYVARTPRGEALVKEGKNKYEDRGTGYKYTPEQLALIEKQILTEEVRGGEPRYVEDVAVGDPLGPVVKGPLTTTDIIAFYSGAAGARHYGGAHGDMVRYHQRHADYHISEVTGAKDSAGRGHVETKTGNDVGMGGAYDLCPQRISWGGHLLSNWIGDDGFVYKFDVQVRKPNLVGDTTWWTGEVTGKTTVQDQPAVELSIQAVNQMDVQTAVGTAVVLLPSREAGPVRLPLTPDE